TADTDTRLSRTRMRRRLFGGLSHSRSGSILYPIVTAGSPDGVLNVSRLRHVQRTRSAASRAGYSLRRLRKPLGFPTGAAEGIPPGGLETCLFRLKADLQPCARRLGVFLECARRWHAAAAFQTRNNGLRGLHTLCHLLLRQASSGTGFD